MRALYKNHVYDDDCVITSLTEHPQFLFSDGLIDTRLAIVSRTLDDADQWIKFSFNAAINVTDIAILQHNMTNAATIKLEGNATDSWTSPSFSRTLTWKDVICEEFATQSYRYWRVTIDDDANPDGYIEIGHISIAEGLDMPGFNPEFSWYDDIESTQSWSTSGQLYANKGVKFKIIETNHTSVVYSVRSSIQTYFDTVDLVLPHVISFFEDDWLDGLTYHPPVYCALTRRPEWNRGDNLWTLKLSYRECK